MVKPVEALDGGAIGQVTVSNDPALKEGDLVQSGFGWREGFNAPAASLQKLDPRGLPVQAFLGAAGMPGLVPCTPLGTVKAAGFRRRPRRTRSCGRPRSDGSGR